MTVLRTHRPLGLAALGATLVATLVATGCGTRRGEPELAPPVVTAGIPESTVGTNASPGRLSDADLGQRDVFRLEELLQGRVPGVRVLRGANGQVSLLIRGGSSLHGSNEPLYIIDGMQLTGDSFSSALANLSPTDVVRVKVLKDASATLYGARGANGVIIISTTR